MTVKKHAEAHCLAKNNGFYLISIALNEKMEKTVAASI